MLRCTITAVLFSFIALGNAATAFSQDYPIKPIRIVVPTNPGGGSDLFARQVGPKLSSALGEQVIVDNRGGAGGNIGTELVAKALPDGYTLLLAALSHAINPALYTKLQFDPIKDFAPVTQVTRQAYIFVVPPSLPAKSVKEFAALAKAKSGGLSYASSGVGEAAHLGMELLKTAAGFDVIHVPYKGTGPAMVAVIGGEVSGLFASMPAGLPHVKSGKLRALAVTSLQRSMLLPDIPTVVESGYPGYELDGWKGILVPAKTPRKIVIKLYEELAKVLKLPDIRERMAADGSEPVGTTPEEFSAYLNSELVKWAKVVKQTGARAD